MLPSLETLKYKGPSKSTCHNDFTGGLFTSYEAAIILHVVIYFKTIPS